MHAVGEYPIVCYVSAVGSRARPQNWGCPLRLVPNMTLHNALRCVAFVLTLVATQHDTRIDLDSTVDCSCVNSKFLFRDVMRHILLRVLELRTPDTYMYM